MVCKDFPHALSSTTNDELVAWFKWWASAEEWFGLVWRTGWAKGFIFWHQSRWLTPNKARLNNRWSVHLYDSFDFVEPVGFLSFNYQTAWTDVLESTQGFIGYCQSTATILFIRQHRGALLSCCPKGPSCWTHMKQLTVLSWFNSCSPFCIDSPDIGKSEVYATYPTMLCLYVDSLLW